jgi:glycosyltransferase involved in cell wall biosynthesis
MDFYNKNILLIIHQGYLGGAERQGLGIAEILTRKYNCKVDVLLTFSGSMNSEFREFANACHVRNIFHFGTAYLYLPKGISLNNLKRLKWSLEYLMLLRKKLIPYKYDIIIPFLNFPSKLSYFLYKLLPTAKFTFWHQLGYDKVTLDYFENIAVNNIPCVIANAENGLDMFKNMYRLNSRKLFVLPQYLSMKYTKGDPERLSAKYGICRNTIVIGMIAHYRPEKLHKLLLDAFKDLTEIYDQIHLVFLGNKDLPAATEKFDDLQNFVKNFGLSSKVTLLEGEKVQDVLSLIDIGVLVSEIEGMPNVVMEYMLYGLPVVATKHPGCVELLKDSVFLIENEKSILIKALSKLIESKELRNAEGKINLENIKAYDKQSYIENLQLIMDKSLK